MRKRTASRYAGRYHQAPPTSRSRAADVSPPWLGESNAVPRKSNIVQRLANRQPGAAGASPPWVCKPRLQRQCAGFFAQTRARLSARPRRCVADDGCIRVNKHHGGLTPPALVHRVPQTGCRRRWTSIRGSFRFSRGANAPRSCVAGRMSAGEKDFSDAPTPFAGHTRTRTEAADVSTPWLGEPDAVPRKSREPAAVNRTRTGDCPAGADDASPPWVWKRFCTDTSAIVRKTADGVCACVWMTVASALIGTTGG
jgi:hypothetical protein